MTGRDFWLVNQWSGLVADTQGGGTTAGTALVQNTNNGATSQRWRFSLQARYPRKGAAGYVDRMVGTKIELGLQLGPDTTVSLPPEVIFNPMQWGNFNWDIGSSSGPVEQFLSAWQREDKAMHYLGFNEPDGADQSNLTVDKAIELWPRLERMDHAADQSGDHEPRQLVDDQFHGAGKHPRLSHGCRGGPQISRTQWR